MSKEYWIKRAAARMTEYVADSERTANIIGEAYKEASSYFADEAKRILSGFERSFGLTQAEAKQVLNNAPAKSVIKTLRKAASQTADPEKLARLNAMISSPAYRWRIDRLEKLSQEITKKCKKLYNIEVKKGNRSLLDTARKAYRMSAKDTAAIGGIESSWTEFPEESIKEILKNGWNGKNYSQRVWHNRQGLGPALRQELLTDLLTGRDPNIAAHNLAERFNVSISDARRLMRTETNYISNQAELQQLKDMGAKQYEFCAALDERTSELCRSLNGKIFNIDEAVVGVNLPPMHPYCRSIILYVAEEEEDDDDELWSDEEFNSRIDEILKKLDAIEEAAKPKKKAGKGKKGVDKSGESGIINYAKSDSFEIVGDASKDSVTEEKIVNELSKSQVGRDAVDYLNKKGIKPQLIYGKQWHTNRGSQQGNVIKVFISNVHNSELVAAQTIVHEVCHHQYGISQSQWAETVCMAKEKMLKENRERLTIAEKRKLIRIAKEYYGEFNWRKGGTINGKKR